MQILLLLAGLILLIVGGSWFAGAATVGVVCLVVFAIITLFQIIAIAGFRKARKSMVRDFHSRW